MTRKPKRCLVGWNPGVISVSESLNQWREALKVCQTSPTTCTRWRCRPMISIAKLQSATQRSPSGLYRRLRRKTTERKHRTVFVSRRSGIDRAELGRETPETQVIDSLIHVDPPELSSIAF